ncbi:MAG: DUF3718 domain-containing protein [Gammaproteobacteria bacterium]|nr:DUF3718 domain-containing protein [Gammaproteobacteria bacterium]
MGIVTKGLTAVLFTFGLAATANAAQYTAADNTPESKLCVSAATASKVKMHRQVKNFRSSQMPTSNYTLIANELYCNGVNVAEFARQAGNDVVASKLAKYRKSNVQIRDLANLRQGNVHVGSL